MTFAPYAGKVPTAFPYEQCHLDAVNRSVRAGSATVSKGQPLVPAGWAGDGHGTPADGYLLLLAGGGHVYSLHLETGGSRPDVANALHSPNLSTSGYNVTADASQVGDGRYLVYLAKPAGGDSACNLHFELTAQ